MTEQDSNSNESNRRYKWKYGPLRLIMPWVCIIVGIGLVIKGLIDPSNDGTLFVLIGAGFVVLGIAAAIIARWMAKRGI